MKNFLLQALMLSWRLPPFSCQGGGGVEKICLIFKSSLVLLASYYFSWRQRSKFQNNKTGLNCWHYCNCRSFFKAEHTIPPEMCSLCYKPILCTHCLPRAAGKTNLIQLLSLSTPICLFANGNLV